jgi:hypothetical protein
MFGFELLVGLVAVCALVLAIAAVAGVGGRRGERGRRGPTGAAAATGSDGPPTTLNYYLKISDFADSFIQIPTSNVGGSGTTIASSYLAGRSPLYNSLTNLPVGTCSASFLNMQTPDGVFTDISNYISTVDGLIVTWFTPTTLINLALDSLINAMVTECIVTVTTKVGASAFFRQTFQLVVSSDTQNINFSFSST